jgi:hypothetical protein
MTRPSPSTLLLGLAFPLAALFPGDPHPVVTER